MPSSSSKPGRAAQTKLPSVAKQEFVLPDDIPIDPEATLDQLTGRFRAVRDGLPELVKNSKDQYSRLGVKDAPERQIVVISSTEKRSLVVLDFAGAPAENFKGWTKWSDPNAGKSDAADDIEAGHGNGGKAFMVRGATETAFLESCYQGRRTRKGFVNTGVGRRYKPGFAVRNGVKLDNVPETDPTSRLTELLATLGTSFGKLPASAQAAFKKRNAYTAAYLEQVVEWSKCRKATLKDLASRAVAEIVGTHGQTAMTIETCQVWIMVDGDVVGDSYVKPVDIEPYPGFEQPREFQVPDLLPDPETGESVDVMQGHEGARFLRLKTSARQLQMSTETRAKNVIRVWNNRNNVATWPLQALHEVSAASFIYGELRCPSLQGEHLSGADRIHLSDTPLVRALQHWTQEKVEELTNDLHQAMAEKTSPKEREKARHALSHIRNLMRQYLEPESHAGDEEGEDEGGASGDGNRGGKEPRYKQTFGSRVDEIILEPGKSEINVICGAEAPLRFKCLEAQDDGGTKPVKDPGLILKCDPPGQFSLNSEGSLLAASPGVGAIWLVTPDGSLESNRLEVWAGDAMDVTAELPSEPLKQGEKRALKFTFDTTEGPLSDAILDAEVADPTTGKIGRLGTFTAGDREADAIIRVRFGGDSGAVREFTLKVGPERIEKPEANGKQGGDVPEILICGDTAPGTDDLPPEKRTHPGGPKLPTVIEEPMWPNVVWINPQSKEAMRVRKSVGGSGGMSRVMTKTFLHFVALKCFDILKRLHVRQRIRGTKVTEYEYMQYAVDAEMDCAEFVDAAWDMSDDLLKDGFANA